MNKSCFCPGVGSGPRKGGSHERDRVHIWGSLKNGGGRLTGWVLTLGGADVRLTGSNCFCTRVIQEERQSYSLGLPQRSLPKAKDVIKHPILWARVIKSCILKSGVQNIFCYLSLVA